MGDRLIILTVCGLSSVVLALLGVPLAGRRIPPNWIYGFRLPQTVNDPALWYPANVFAGRGFVLLGLVCFAVTVAGYFLPMRDFAYGLTVAITLVGGSLVLLAACLVWLARRLRARNARPRR